MRESFAASSLFFPESQLFAPEQAAKRNQLLYGDNLTIMRNMPSACVDLIYLDPPFNSQRSYNLIYKQLTGLPVPEQEEAFCDAWELDPEKEQMAREMPILLREYDVDDGLVSFWTAWIGALRNTQPRLLAYLVYMTYRLFEMRRILKPHGSIYLHCDPTASHYIKVMMDGVFGHSNFRNEIVWKRSQPKGHATVRFSRSHDVILVYAKSDRARFRPQYRPHDPEYVAKFYRHFEPGTGRRYRLGDLTNPNKNRPNLTYEFPVGSGTTRVWRWTRERMQREWEAGRVVVPDGGVAQGKRYLDEMAGTLVTDWWDDIEHLHGVQGEALAGC